jgi:hypothetical protein
MQTRVACNTSMLASLLPGLRDLRAPLAAGYIWLAAGWLYFAPQLPTSVEDADGVIKDIYRTVDASNPVAVAAGLTFIAYLLGILSIDFLTPVVNIILILLAFTITTPLLAISRIREYLRERRQGLHLTNFEDDLWASFKRRRFWTSAEDRKLDLLVGRVSTQILTDADYRNTFMEKLEERSIRRFIRRMEGFGDYRYQSVMDYPWEEKENKLVEVRKMLAEDLQEGSKTAAVALFASEVNVYEHLREIDKELDLVPERIVGDKPATYERWDRLIAEAEFRQGTLLPLSAIIAALWARGVLGWPLWLLATSIPLVIYYQGVLKANAAEAQLIQTIEANVVQLTALEKLTTADLRWRY